MRPPKRWENEFVNIFVAKCNDYAEDRRLWKLMENNFVAKFCKINNNDFYNDESTAPTIPVQKQTAGTKTKVSLKWMYNSELMNIANLTISFFTIIIRLEDFVCRRLRSRVITPALCHYGMDQQWTEQKYRLVRYRAMCV